MCVLMSFECAFRQNCVLCSIRTSRCGPNTHVLAVCTRQFVISSMEFVSGLYRFHDKVIWRQTTSSNHIKWTTKKHAKRKCRRRRRPKQPRNWNKFRFSYANRDAKRPAVAAANQAEDTLNGGEGRKNFVAEISSGKWSNAQCALPKN